MAGDRRWNYHVVAFPSLGHAVAWWIVVHGYEVTEVRPGYIKLEQRHPIVSSVVEVQEVP